MKKLIILLISTISISTAIGSSNYDPTLGSIKVIAVDKETNAIISGAIISINGAQHSDNIFTGCVGDIVTINVTAIGYKPETTFRTLEEGVIILAVFLEPI